MAETILGIDLGTTHSLVGAVDGGFPILLADEQGARLLPSAVAWPKNAPPGAPPVVGAPALRLAATEPRRVARSIKRLIGRRPGEGDWQPPFAVALADDGSPGIAIGETCVSAVDASAAILTRLRETAAFRLGREVDKAVISVPAYFHHGQRQATIEAGRRAGLDVVRIINEPTAAALACGLDRLKSPAKIAVYDLGGGTFDISILEHQDRVFQVLSSHGDTLLGGDDLDLAIAREAWHRADGDQDQWRELPLDALQRLLATSRQVKENLATCESETLALPFLTPGTHLEVAFTRDDLDRLAEPLVQRTLVHCRQALADADLAAGELDAVVLVGGSTRLAAVRRTVGAFFGREPLDSGNPDEAVAKGTVIQAGILSGALRDMVLVDVTPLSLGIETVGGLMNVIIPRNSTIPAKAGEVFTNAADGQSAMRVRILQGEREMARDNWELGSIDVPFEPMPKGRCRVGIQFAIDANGVLTVLARDIHTGHDQTLRIESSAVDVDDSKVGEMIASSIDHALEDFHERRWTEAALKAKELLPAVAAALDVLDGKIDAQERREIESAAKRTETAIKGSDHQALKEAVDTLDAATEGIAALLVETALEESLERRTRD